MVLLLSHQYGVCAKHGLAREFWCSSCNEGLCGHCLLESNHLRQDHSVITINAFLQHTRTQAADVALRRLTHIDGEKMRVMSKIYNSLFLLYQHCEEAKALSFSLKKTQDLVEEVQGCLNVESVLKTLSLLSDYAKQRPADERLSDPPENRQHDAQPTDSPPPNPDIPGSPTDIDRSMASNRLSPARIKRSLSSPIKIPVTQWNNRWHSPIRLTLQESTTRLSHSDDDCSADDLYQDKSQHTGLSQSDQNTTSEEGLNLPTLESSQNPAATDEANTITGTTGATNKAPAAKTTTKEATQRTIPETATQTTKDNPLRKPKTRASETETEDGAASGMSSEGKGGSKLMAEDDGSWLLKCCVLNQDGRQARLRWEDGRLHLYSLTKHPYTTYITLQVRL